ncbi:site-specific integrase [Paraburkholderia sp. FT54]|uniref:site-specific integrase n=1 Tax=Paraburkholderia sp. FT54 TaxID=3074437 RepID=UPI0028780B86|nr:site-specific integrase [Paraburkholderia sp. FT54]WNC90242.1 site-specific integrase [Paraburkholderia sp. FT54]
MATVSNRSRYRVTVSGQEAFGRDFPYSARDAVRAYVDTLRTDGHRPRVARTDDCYEVRIRNKGFPELHTTVASPDAADTLIKFIEGQRATGLYIDYAKALKVTFADLLVRYLREEAPRQKSFEMVAYKINGLLEDAGLARVDPAGVLRAHPAPHPSLTVRAPRRATGVTVRTPTGNLAWLHRPFAQLMPTDINDYIDERCQWVEPATVDRELDIFSSVCHLAMETWRIEVARSPMDGVRRPRYYNERDRRLRGDEEARLLDAAYDEDRRRSIAQRLEELMADARTEAELAPTVYQQKAIIREARERFLPEAEAGYTHVPLIEAFVQFQLMTAARRSETLAVQWQHVDLDERTVFLPETKNGRPRKLPVRAALVELLAALPRTDARVFPLTADHLRKIWTRLCAAAGIEDLRMHDLRHEAISRVADTGTMSLVDLQAFSGHRDTRMLLRYAHLCAKHLAHRLDAAFGATPTAHRGLRRLPRGAALTLTDLVRESAAAASGVDACALPANVVRFPGARQAAR